MPRYDYRCPLCGEIVERQHGFDVTEVRSWCDQHQQEVPLERLFTMPVVHYRTDGFYNYDNADPVTRYQRDHFSESGDRSDQKLSTRRRRRGNETTS